MTTDAHILETIQAAWRAYAGDAPFPDVQLDVRGGDRSLVVTPPTPDAAAIWIDYGQSYDTVWVAVGQDSRFELEHDQERLFKICRVPFEGRFKDRIRVRDRRLLQSEGLVEDRLATTHEAAWACDAPRDSEWTEIAYRPYPIPSNR